MYIRDESIDAAPLRRSGMTRTRRLIIGMLAAVAMMVALPAASQAAQWVSHTSNSSGNNINNTTQSFGSGLTGNYSLSKTFYMGNDTFVFSGTTRTAQFNMPAGSHFEPIPGSGCNMNIIDANTFRGSFSTSGLSSGGSCSFSMRLKAGKAPGVYTTVVPWTNAGNFVAGTVTLTATVSDEIGNVIRAYGPTPSTAEVSNYDFGEVAIGDSSTRQFTLKNTGSTAVANFARSLTGASPDYSITATTCGTTLAVASQCTVDVKFQPAAAGSHPKTLNFTSSSGHSDSIVFSGTSFAPEASLDVVQSSLDYGVSPTGSESTLPITVQNTGNTTLDLSLALDPGTDPAVFYRNGGTCGATLGVGNSCTMNITFLPDAGGPAAQSGSVTVSGTTFLVPTPATDSVSLSGTRGPAAASIQAQDTAGLVNLTSRQIGTATIGGTTSYTFTIRNTGNVPVPSVAPSFSGPNAGQFSVTGTTCNSPIPRYGTCTITVQFSATTGGPARAKMTLTPGNAAVQAAATTVDLTASVSGVRIVNDVNANLTGANHKRWLDTLSAGGAQSGGDRVRVALEVEKGAADQIEDLLVSTTLTTTDSAPDGATFIPVPGGIGRVEVQGRSDAPNALVIGEIPGASIFGTSAGSYGFNDDAGSFLSIPYTCGILGNGGTWKADNRRAWFRVRTTSGELSQAVGSIVRFTDGRRVCGGGPIVYDQQVASVGGTTQPAGTLNAVADKNQAVSFSFKGSAGEKASSSSPGYFTGINWRIRNSRTGDMFRRNGAGWTACAAPCNDDGGFTTASGSRIDFGDQTPGVNQTLTLPNGLPSRGRWVVEGAPRGTGQDLAYFMQIGSVLVNSVGNSPTISLSGTPPARPATDSDWNITANVSDPLDGANGFDTQGGRAQVLEWDLNNNTTDGPAGDGFELRSEGTPSGGIPANLLTEEFTTEGKQPGQYTIRARVTDNGGINGADNSRRSAIASTTFTINSPPEAITENVDIEADQDQPAQIEFRANDAD